MTSRRPADPTPLPAPSPMSERTAGSSAGQPAAGDHREAFRIWSDLMLRRCGLALRESQMPELAALVQERMEARGVTGHDAYFDRLEAESDGGSEWAHLAERLANHETSFFRHPRSFEVLSQAVLPALRHRPHAGTRALSLWSAGCSSGQEAYSLAMVAMADEATAGAFTVWGTDFSRRTLETARRGRYSQKAVAAIPPMYRHRFLRLLPDATTAEPYEVVGDLRQRVRFVAGNLFAAGSGVLSYDVIFCQNVLIYFPPTAFPELVSTLGARLHLGGYLLLGPGEAPIECPAGLELVDFGGVRAFRRNGRARAEVRP